MNLVSKLRKEFYSKGNIDNNYNRTFLWSTHLRIDINIHIDKFDKWKELKEKGYTDQELFKYFTQWVKWKFPRHIKKVKKLKFFTGRGIEKHLYTTYLQ